LAGFAVASAAAVLQDWDALYRVSGIKSFMAVPIGGAGEVLGLLTIAKQEPGAFNDEWCVWSRVFADRSAMACRQQQALLPVGVQH
jgi:transcriptional regulator with GAF, ATPase, and Fis domain